MEGITNAEVKELAERLGICWHDFAPNPRGLIGENRCTCGKMFITGKQLRFHVSQQEKPDFTNPLVVLEIARKREDWPEFIFQINHRHYYAREYHVVPINLILNHTGKLAKLLLLWLREKEVK